MQQIQVVRKQSRYSKGSVIAASRRILKVHNENSWLVESEITDDMLYKVSEDGTMTVWTSRIEVESKHMWASISRGIV
jgi:hypothetical protein